MTDRRRYNGPSLSTAPLYPDEEDANSENSKRSRPPSEPRKTFLRCGLIPKANGSAYIELERTKLVCSIYGPRQLTKGVYSSTAKVICEVKYAPFACKKRHGYVKDSNERDMSILLADAITPSILTYLFPKSEIAIYVTILESDGELATLAAGVTCISAALVDAGVDCIDVVTGGAILIKSNDLTTIYVDPVEADELDADVAMVIGYMSQRQEITMLHTKGEVEDTALEKLTRTCLSQCHLNRQILDISLQPNI